MCSNNVWGRECQEVRLLISLDRGRGLRLREVTCLVKSYSWWGWAGIRRECQYRTGRAAWILERARVSLHLNNESPFTRLSSFLGSDV